MPSCHDHLPPVDLARVSAVSILSGEHQVILQTLSSLQAIAQRAQDEGRIPRPHADQALEVLRLFADRCHHGKEEDVLFPALEGKVVGFAPTAVMRAEHVDGRAHIAAMMGAIESDAVDDFASHALDYVGLLRAHIEKEDEILFRMAQEMLSEDEDADLLAAYRAIEHDDMGDGTHERLLGLADSLAAAYDVPRASADPAIMRLLTAVCGCKSGASVQPGAAPWRERAAGLRYLAEKVGRVHGESHPAMRILAEVVARLAESDQDAARALAPRLAELTDHFQPWEGACASVWQLFAGLQELAGDLPAQRQEAVS